MSLLNIHAHMTFDIVVLWDARRDVDNTISNLWLAHLLKHTSILRGMVSPFGSMDHLWRMDLD